MTEIASQIQYIPLNKLILSPRNVRKTDGEENIESLANSILKHGLLKNLVVSEGETGKLWEVDAGGRRWRALNLLAKNKDLPRNWPVPCLVIPRADARDASLAENIENQAMNPADEVEAFAAIVESGAHDGATAGDETLRIVNCARRFGRTERYVRERLRLAALAPEILDALRDRRIGIEAARAYATHPDHAVQIKVFKSEDRHPSEEWRHRPNTVRDSLRGKIYPADHWLVCYVGIDAYREAGGRIEADLFFGEESGGEGGAREQLLDPAIIDRLARDKAETEAQRLAQADGWLDAELAPLGAGSWVEPKTPKNYVRCAWGAAADVPPSARATAIAAYRLDRDGTIVPMERHFYRPAAEVEEADEDDRSAPVDWKARDRADEIRLIAARNAVPAFAGTPLEGRVFWPEHDGILDEENEDGGKICVITALIAIPSAEVDARLAEAEIEYEAALAAAREAVARDEGVPETEAEPAPGPAPATAQAA